MGIRFFIISLYAIPNVAMAAGFICQGTAPDWSLTLSDTSASFAYYDRTSTLEIPQASRAEGAEWPRAYTLIGPRDSAILIVTDQTCDTGDHSAHVLTQRGQTPVLLTGCCTSAGSQ